MTTVMIDVATEDGPALPSDVKIGLYRIAQEATANAIRHASATVVRIELQRSEKEVRLEIRDDGRGFFVDATDAGHGLQSIRERADLIGAQLRIEGSESSGSVVAIVWSADPTPSVRSCDGVVDSRIGTDVST
jgi:signal transduction histidine kinase